MTRPIVSGPKPIDAMERIRRRSETQERGYLTPCRVWLGGLTQAGYGPICVGSRSDRTMRQALIHRVVWEHHNGPIPSGLTIDHLCRQRDCHEITHLEVVTRTENVRRGFSMTAINARKTHCPHGHEFTPENTYLWTQPSGRLGRQCKTCQAKRSRDWQRAHRDRKKQ